MNQAVFFSETQKFDKWYHWALILLAPAICCITFIFAYTEVTQNEKETAVIGFLISTVIFVLIIVWFLVMKLETEIDENSIRVNFKAMPFGKRTIPYSELKSIELINYSPLTDYGGWGLKYSISGKGWCYNVSGNDGIKIIYKTGKSLLIGTQKPEAFKEILDSKLTKYITS